MSGAACGLLVELNPMYPMLTGYANLLQDQAYPPLWMWIAAGRLGDRHGHRRFPVLHLEGA